MSEYSSGPVGTTRWVIGDGYIPTRSTGPEPELTSHESLCILNAGPEPANVTITVFFTDRDPAGPYAFTIAARRAYHQRMNDLAVPEPMPIGVDYSALIESDQPIVVQHRRIDTRQAENAAMSTIAYPAV